MSETALVPSGRPGGAVAVVRPVRPELMPSPIEKAALILTAIGPELASGILRDLGDAEMERFAAALRGLGKVPQAVFDAVVTEFLDLLTSGPEVVGGTQAARKLLEAVLDDPDEIERLLSGRQRGTLRSVWERLNEAPLAALTGFVSAEHPQTAAVILSEIRPDVAAGLLERFETGFARAIVMRLSRVPSLDAPIMESIQGAIERDFLSVLQRNLSKRRPAELIAGLMNNISSEARDGFLGYLESQDARLAQDVQRTMFTFEDIATRLNGRDIAGVLRDVPEDVLLRALKLGQTQSNATVAFILENLPRRLAERYVEDLAGLEEIARKDGEAAQIEITKAIQEQVRAGTIRFIDKEAGPA